MRAYGSACVRSHALSMLRTIPCGGDEHESGVHVQATKHLTDIRPCGPKTDAIRGATYDQLDGRGFDTFQHLPPESYAYLSQEQRQHIRSKVAALV